jgi:hypothetical protein
MITIEKKVLVAKCINLEVKIQWNTRTIDVHKNMLSHVTLPKDIGTM